MTAAVASRLRTCWTIIKECLRRLAVWTLWGAALAWAITIAAWSTTIFHPTTCDPIPAEVIDTGLLWSRMFGIVGFSFGFISLMFWGTPTWRKLDEQRIERELEMLRRHPPKPLGWPEIAFLGAVALGAGILNLTHPHLVGDWLQATLERRIDAEAQVIRPPEPDWKAMEARMAQCKPIE